MFTFLKIIVQNLIENSWSYTANAHKCSLMWKQFFYGTILFMHMNKGYSLGAKFKKEMLQYFYWVNKNGIINVSKHGNYDGIVSNTNFPCFIIHKQYFTLQFHFQIDKFPSKPNKVKGIFDDFLVYPLSFNMD